MAYRAGLHTSEPGREANACAAGDMAVRLKAETVRLEADTTSATG